MQVLLRELCYVESLVDKSITTPTLIWSEFFSENSCQSSVDRTPRMDCQSSSQRTLLPKVVALEDKSITTLNPIGWCNEL